MGEPKYVIRISDDAFMFTDLHETCYDQMMITFFVTKNRDLAHDVKQFFENKFNAPEYNKIMEALTVENMDVDTTKYNVFEVNLIFDDPDIYFKNKFLGCNFSEDTIYFEGISNVSNFSGANDEKFNGPAIDEIRGYFGDKISV